MALQLYDFDFRNVPHKENISMTVASVFMILITVSEIHLGSLSIIIIYNYNYYNIIYIYGAWAIALVTFDVLREIYAYNMPIDREI